MRTLKAAAGAEGVVSLRQRILDEAIDFVSRGGGEGITMRALANRLGYSPATIYLHYRNKEELRQDIARNGFAQLSARLLPSSQHEDAEQALREIARRYVDFALETPALYRLMFGELEPTGYDAPPGLEFPGRGLADGMRDFHARGVKSGAFRAADSDEQASLGWSLLHGFAMLALDGRMPPPRLAERSVEELRDVLIDTWLRALRP